MAGIPDDALVTLRGFPAGVNNVAPLERVPRDDSGLPTAARELVNTDLDAAGRPRRMRGWVVERSASAHSLFADPSLDYLLGVVGGDLRAYDAGPTGLIEVATLVPGLGDRFVTYATDDDQVWWSTATQNGRIGRDLSLHPFWPGTPDPVRLVATAEGALGRGTYEVAVTVLDAEGRESGASSPVSLTLTSGQGIAVTLPAPPEGAVRWRIYRTTPDGEVLYRAQELPSAATTAHLGHAELGPVLQTDWLFPMLPVTTLRYAHNRFLGLAGNTLYWTRPYTGLMHDSDHLVLGQEATLLEPVGEGGEGAGWFVADHKRTYFLDAPDPKAWRQIARYPHPAVPGTSLTLPGSVFGYDTAAPVAFWLARNGVFCLGLPGGQVVPLREGELALPVDSERGAAAFYTFDGIRQIVVSILAGAENPLALGDSASATIRRHGIEL